MPHWLLRERDGLVVTCVMPGVECVNWSGVGMSSPQWMQHLMGMRWTVGCVRWKQKRVVRLARAGEEHTINLEWDQATGTFVRWYVNLQAPFQRRTLQNGTVAFDTYDHVLDIVVRPNGEVELKDDEELTVAEPVGLFTAAEAAAIRSEAKRLVANLDALLPTGWEAWRPDLSWPLPALPGGSDHLD